MWVLLQLWVHLLLHMYIYSVMPLAKWKWVHTQVPAMETAVVPHSRFCYILTSLIYGFYNIPVHHSFKGSTTYITHLRILKHTSRTVSWDVRFWIFSLSHWSHCKLSLLDLDFVANLMIFLILKDFPHWEMQAIFPDSGIQHGQNSVLYVGSKVRKNVLYCIPQC